MEKSQDREPGKHWLSGSPASRNTIESAEEKTLGGASFRRSLPTGAGNDAFNVLRTLERREREVQVDGHWFLVRLGPYRTVEDRIDGVVVSFIDITPLKKVEARLRENMDQVQRFIGSPSVGSRE